MPTEAGSCSSGDFSIKAWWEILPAAATHIDMTVNAGDTMSVDIWQVDPGEWDIQLKDDTSGQTFTTLRNYDGPGDTVEWITEASKSGACGGKCTLAPYSPAIDFTNLGLTGNTAQSDEITMVQDGVSVSTPSGLTGNGFDNTYTGTTDGLQRRLPPWLAGNP